jgi:formyl-CoA transferase
MLLGRDRWRQVDTPGGPVRALLPPVTLDGVTARMDAVPSVGEHTDTILRALGRTDTDIARLRADGTI